MNTEPHGCFIVVYPNPPGFKGTDVYMLKSDMGTFAATPHIDEATPFGDAVHAHYWLAKCPRIDGTQRVGEVRPLLIEKHLVTGKTVPAPAPPKKLLELTELCSIYVLGQQTCGDHVLFKASLLQLLTPEQRSRCLPQLPAHQRDAIIRLLKDNGVTTE